MKAAEVSAALSQLHEATQLAIDCAEPAFKVYLNEIHAMPEPLTDDNAVAWTFQLIGIRAAPEFRTNEDARRLWSVLRSDFLEWRTA